jgi:hypothetical protein
MSTTKHCPLCHSATTSTHDGELFTCNNDDCAVFNFFPSKMTTTSTTPPDYRIVTEHACTVQATAALRWLRKPHSSLAVHSMELQQAWQCVQCGKVEWSPVEIVEDTP